MNTRLQRGLAWVLMPLFFSVALSACQRAGEDSGAASSGDSGSGTSQSGGGESSAGGGMGDSGAAGGSDSASDKPKSPQGD